MKKSLFILTILATFSLACGDSNTTKKDPNEIICKLKISHGIRSKECKPRKEWGIKGCQEDVFKGLLPH